jgi:hypothetical protein
MAEGALGISTGIGQGEAQIIKPFQSPVTAQQYGSVMAAQQKAKADKRSKTLANIETLDFKGMPNEAGLFAKAYDEIVQFVEDNVYDPYVDIKMKQKISDLKTRANMSYDRKMAINNIVGDVQKGEGKNIYLGIDDALQSAVADIDYNTFSNTEAYGKVNAERMAKLSGVKTTPIYDIGAASLDLQRGMAAWGQANKDENGKWKVPENVIDDFVNKELMGHPHAYATFEVAMKKDPVGAKAANYQVDKYAFNTLKNSIKAEGSTKSSNTTFNIGIGDGGNKVTENVVTEQVRPIGVGGRNVKVRAFLYEKPVDLGARTQAERMFKIDTAGNTVSVEADAPPVSYNETIEAPVSTVDIEWIGRDGEKRTVKKGQIVDPDDAKAYAEFFTGKQIPTENALLSFGFDSDNNKYYEPAERIAPASIASFYGAKGATAKSEYIKKGVEKTPSTTGGTKTKSKKDVKLY